ncbi:hypothetical protein Vafri_4208 [Volvox africanus]|uniref:Uncharacterized protein n=1 Tax=Volvox africanus TaxID=51714 RepID=A0A8J4ATK0_9CHLO|nr:hypothetical protein Vafri_4208 [Volvox africanus]
MNFTIPYAPRPVASSSHATSSSPVSSSVFPTTPTTAAPHRVPYTAHASKRIRATQGPQEAGQVVRHQPVDVRKASAAASRQSTGKQRRHRCPLARIHQVL